MLSLTIFLLLGGLNNRTIRSYFWMNEIRYYEIGLIFRICRWRVSTFTDRSIMNISVRFSSVTELLMFEINAKGGNYELRNTYAEWISVCSTMENINGMLTINDTTRVAAYCTVCWPAFYWHAACWFVISVTFLDEYRVSTVSRCNASYCIHIV